MITSLKKAIGWSSRIGKYNHKSYLRIFFELFFWVIAHRGGINFYFNYELFVKGKKPGDFLKPHQYKKIERELNTPEYYPILEDKYFFSQILFGQGFKIPRNIYLIDPTGIFDLEQKKFVSNQDFIQKDLDGFCKIINGFGGLNIFRLLIRNRQIYLNEKETSLKDFLKILGKRKYLVQDRIIQHPRMNSLNPSCVNTLRLVTVRIGNQIILYQYCLRIGINNNYVDNSHAGNIIIGIDNESGRLLEHAYSNDESKPQYKLDKHPQTEVVFKDFSIPYYDEAVEMVKSLHLLFQQFFIIGWDIGITPDGPILLEGNNITELYVFQVMYGGLKESFYNIADKYRASI